MTRDELYRAAMARAEVAAGEWLSGPKMRARLVEAIDPAIPDREAAALAEHVAHAFLAEIMNQTGCDAVRRALPRFPWRRRALMAAFALPLALGGCADGAAFTIHHDVDVRLSTDACPPRAGEKAKAEIAALDPKKNPALLGYLEQLGKHRNKFGCN